MNPSELHFIVAFVQPFVLEGLVDVLRLVSNFPGMSVSEVRGFGRHLAHAPRDAEVTEVEPFEKRVRIEIGCRSAELQPILDTLAAAAHTGNAGDGKIFVMTMARAIRIRTREAGSESLLLGRPSDEPHA
ncbi:MAG: P-II family nitrogen regulator [Acidobacteria bacterium]|nr:MAG: P-II family nitrogen regulator [Acidobacteriota bacterium]MCE7956397.1 P-II family nitrogen regulator [Acidobacteria bacterium ACB2]